MKVAVVDAPNFTKLGFNTEPLRGLHLSNLPLLEALNLGGSHMRDLRLDKLPNVKRFYLRGAILSESLVQQASHVPGLNHVQLRNMRAGEGRSRITAADLAFLRTAKRLETVSLWGTSLAPVALSVLRGHQQLETLTVRRCGLTDSSLGDLATLPNLRCLDLQDNPINGAGLRHLADLQNLEQLRLNQTHLDDLGAKYLASLSNLRVLELRGASITDQGLIHLHCLTDLQSLSLPDNISEVARRQLRTSLQLTPTGGASFQLRPRQRVVRYGKRP